MGAVLEFAAKLESTTCANCGMEFAAPAHWITTRREKHDSFYCPAGHPLKFHGETEAERLKRELRIAEDDAGIARKRAANAEMTAKRERTMRKNMEQRARGGLCPCCKRSFEDLRRHMNSKHPDFGHALHAAKPPAGPTS